MVCGVGTAVVDDYRGHSRDRRYGTNSGTSPTWIPTATTYVDVVAPYGIRDEVYGFDWNERKTDGSGGLQDIGGYQFIIYGDGIEAAG